MIELFGIDYGEEPYETKTITTETRGGNPTTKEVKWIPDAMWEHPFDVKINGRNLAEWRKLADEIPKKYQIELNELSTRERQLLTDLGYRAFDLKFPKRPWREMPDHSAEALAAAIVKDAVDDIMPYVLAVKLGHRRYEERKFLWDKLDKLSDESMKKLKKNALDAEKDLRAQYMSMYLGDLTVDGLLKQIGIVADHIIREAEIKREKWRKENGYYEHSDK